MARPAVLAVALATVAVPSLAVGTAWAAGTTTTVVSPTTTATTPGSPTTTAPIVPLDTLILAQPLPGFTAAPTGPTNGPLTATEFASQSSSPTEAEHLFDSLAAQPGFGASIRLWTDHSGPGAGANDIAVLLFRISQPSLTQSFESGLNQPFDAGTGTSTFAVPSVPGARGYTLAVSTPVKATEQVVVFTAGRYVAMIQLASSLSTTNPDPLTPAQAVTVSYQELTTLTTGDPADAAPTTTTPPTTAATVPATTTAPGVGASAAHRSAVPEVAGAVGVVLLVALVVVAIELAVRRRRRPGPGDGPPGPTGDAWGPGGVFAQFGADDIRSGPGTDGDGGPSSPDLPPRSVPELQLTESGVASG